MKENLTKNLGSLVLLSFHKLRHRADNDLPKATIQGCSRGENGSISPESHPKIFIYQIVLNALEDTLKDPSKDIFIYILFLKNTK